MSTATTFCACHPDFAPTDDEIAVAVETWLTVLMPSWRKPMVEGCAANPGHTDRWITPEECQRVAAFWAFHPTQAEQRMLSAAASGEPT